jgi:hypothetical protein
MSTETSINQIPISTSFDKTRYEQIFKLYKIIKDDENSYAFFNILNKVIIPTSLNSELFGTIVLNSKLPWTTLAYKLYGDIHLWWLIFITNSPDNIFYAEASIEYKYILPQYLNIVLNNISEQVNK